MRYTTAAVTPAAIRKMEKAVGYAERQVQKPEADYQRRLAGGRTYFEVKFLEEAERFLARDRALLAQRTGTLAAMRASAMRAA